MIAVTEHPTLARLNIKFTSYWLSGTGLSRGRHLDVITHRDGDELPAIPMSQIKGQLRETAERLAAAGIARWDQNQVSFLFGERTRDDAEAKPAGRRQGSLAFRGEARLSEQARRFLLQRDNQYPRTRHFQAELFHRIAATSINAAGIADDKTLRAIEAVVPLTLEGDVTWIGESLPVIDWVGMLDAACAATLAFGKLKADGFGRAIASVAAR